ncbi:hypothetical protein RhiirC2_716246 [Rhizophagus irregularis]|uniref:Uncharacterized protein n=1 Tax=Rhizophagus irregularis TaxID=588596 RepID=A0A2N1MS62_9GLOM|nr:hypothetical protein RhiirC2_716246 [Rhizophagus irregularis]
MKQLMQKIQEIRMFSRFAAEDSNNEFDAATAERDKKRKELDKNNEYTSTPTCTNIEGEAQGKEEDYDEYVIADKEKIAFWTGNDQKRRKPESLLTTPISRFSRDKCLMYTWDTVSPEFIDDPTEDRITLIEVSLYKPRVCKEVERSEEAIEIYDAIKEGGARQVPPVITTSHYNDLIITTIRSNLLIARRVSL